MGWFFTKRRIPSEYAAGNVAVRAHRPDYLILILCLCLVAIGMVVVYSISPGLAASQNVSQSYYINKQFIAIIVGLVAFFIVGQTPVRSLRKMRFVLLFAAAAGAALVQLFGEEVNGAYRWIQFGGFSFQSVELIKIALIIYLADLLAAKRSGDPQKDWQILSKPLFTILGLVGFVVAFLQSDLGSAGVIAVFVITVYYLAGIKLKKLAGVALIVLAATVIAISSSPYRRDRVMSFLNPSSSCQDRSYQQCQAMIAVGSGGINGLGLGKSVQAYGYTPEAANDSIFAILAEQFGFIGSSLLLVLYGAFFYRIKKVAATAPDTFSKLLSIGILAWLGTQAAINIGSMIGLLPLKGITLPFISYGGTSLVFVMAATGMVFQVSKHTEYEPIRGNSKGRNNGYDLAMRRGNSRPHLASIGRR